MQDWSTLHHVPNTIRNKYLDILFDFYIIVSFAINLVILALECKFLGCYLKEMVNQLKTTTIFF